jgi:hypothetical protein
MLRIAKHQGQQVEPPANNEWGLPEANALWNRLHKKPWQPREDDGGKGARSDPKTMSNEPWSQLRGALIRLETALQGPLL